jgi:hypothetical protein
MNPGASYQELAKLAGYTHHEHARRIEKRIVKKVSMIYPDYRGSIRQGTTDLKPVVHI